MRISTAASLPFLLLALATVGSGQADSPSSKAGAIRVKLDRAIKQFRLDRAAAGEALKNEIRQAKRDLPKTDLTAREKIKESKTLDAELASFERDRTLPHNPRLEDAVALYIRTVRAAHDACAQGFEVAIEAFGTIDLTLAEKALAEKTRTLGEKPALRPSSRRKEERASAQRTPDTGRYGVELIKNRGCEKPLDENGRVPDWEQIKGRWHRGKPDRKPATGSGYFSSSKRSRRQRGTAMAQIQQSVDLSPFANAIDKERVTAKFSYKVSAFKQKVGPGDQPRVQLVFLDENEDPVGDAHDSGRVSCQGQWKSRRTSLKVPAQTRRALIILQSHRVARGRQTSNDGHFDDLSLKMSSGR